MKLDFMICGTPNDAFYSQIAFFRLCLDYLGGDYKNARLVACFGDHESTEISKRWQPYFNHIDVEWSHPIGAHNPYYTHQHYHRFKAFRKDADLVLICDADTALLRPFPDLIEMCQKKPAICGVIAHLPVPERHDWQTISQSIIKQPITIDHHYTLKPKTPEPNTPFYINYGFLAGTPDLLTEMYHTDITLIDQLNDYVGPFWASQVSVALTVELLNLPKHALPMRYNFPNDRVAETLHADELDKIILIHYLRERLYNRHEIFSSEEGFNAFLNLDLPSSDRVFQDHVKKVTGSQYPFV